MSSGKGQCKKCGAFMKLEPCGECPAGYTPSVCNVCGGKLKIEYPAIAETMEKKPKR